MDAKILSVTSQVLINRVRAEGKRPRSVHGPETFVRYAWLRNGSSRHDHPLAVVRYCLSTGSQDTSLFSASGMARIIKVRTWVRISRGLKLGWRSILRSALSACALTGHRAMGIRRV